MIVFCVRSALAFLHTHPEEQCSHAGGLGERLKRLLGGAYVASTARDGEVMETESRVTGDRVWVAQWNWADQVSQEQHTRRGKERWDLGHVWLQTQMLVCLLGRKERNKEETGPKVIVKRADFLLQTGLFWPVNPSGLNVSSLLFILFLLYI